MKLNKKLEAEGLNEWNMLEPLEDCFYKDENLKLSHLLLDEIIYDFLLIQSSVE